ncbi:tRNA (adenine-N(1))-methyltransferase [Desemzia sp. RIT804]|uniref:tRNA (adenine(22)-N(1))-methyltransferase n=1 Tax=Desemzia sp. RIT 804 TaxID=2810209 RepID=UPI00195036BC|nr:tRNA (adenine(22)-N(1))-methyltransferase TrmK [Desemzia sp. RIT 804]MBM6613811.1 tRNA (adenine-N(1))-methyltransferase [Desemzia sp. RIT 804]
MDEKNLSLRLERVANYVKKNDRLADIGSDHAYLPSALVLNQTIKYAIAGEVVDGPYQSAKSHVAELGFEKQIDVRFGDGLDVVELEDNITAISICGMGGSLIASILDKGFKAGKLSGKERLLLQPNVGEYTLRKWLVEHDYQIVAEDLLEENHKMYEIMIAKKSEQPVEASEADLQFGFLLKKDPTPMFKKKWQTELQKNKYIQESLLQSKSDQTDKLRNVKETIQEIEELLQK